MAKNRITHHVSYNFKASQIFARFILLLICGQIYSSTASDNHFCNVLIHPGEYIRMRVNAKLNLSCDASSLERDPYEVMPKGLHIWENMHQIENHDYKIVNTIITTILNVNAKINNTYTCQTVAPVDIRKMKEVAIGSRPQPVTNFNCISYDFDNWKCTFKANERVPTEYVVSYEISPSIYNLKCVNTSSDDYVCETDLLRNTYRKYSFLLTSKNCFGMRKENFNIRILKNVVPGRLQATVNYVNSTTAKISWNIETYYHDFYAAGFILEVKYRPKYMNSWIEMGKIKTTRISSRLHLTKLMPFNEYTVELRVKAAKAQNSPDMFKYANISFQTDPTRPVFPPVTDPGAFFIDNNRCVHVFWQAVPSYKMNGTNFRYQVRIKRKSSILREDNKIVTADYFYKDEVCEEGEYEFAVRSENSEGFSKEGKPTHVTVPKNSQSQGFPEPHGIKIIHNGTFYKLKWEISGASSKFHLIDFTISTCSPRVLTSSLEFCEDAIDFIHISGKQRTFLYPFHLKRYLTFAISANYRNGSSGMVMTHCIPHENSDLPRLEPKVQMFNDSSITLKWALKCEERALVKGYILTYCNIDNKMDICIEPTTEITDFDPNSTTYTLRDLRPFNNYSLQIALLSSKKQGPFSLPLRQQTAEGVPSAPRRIRVTNITANSAELTWEVPDSPNGVIRYYSIFVNGKKYTELENEWENESYSYWLTNLESYQNYTVTVAAVTVWGSKKLVGEQSDSIDFRTRTGEPGVIELPTVILDGNEMQVSWHPPKIAAGPLKSLVYEIKWCRSDECQIISSQMTKVAMDYSCLDRERIKVFIRAIQNVSNNELHAISARIQQKDDFYQNITLESYLVQYGRWILISDIYCEVQASLVLILSFSTLLLLISLVVIFYKIYLSMKKITLIVPHGLLDISEPAIRNSALSNNRKPSEERNPLKQKQINTSIQDRVETNGNPSSTENTSTLNSTGYMPMKGNIDENIVNITNDSRINIALKIQNHSRRIPFDVMTTEIYSSASLPLLNGNDGTNTAGVCLSSKRATEKDENMHKACRMLLNSQTGHVTMYLKGRGIDQEKNDMERVSIEILYSENSPNPAQRALDEQRSMSKLSEYINRS